MARVHYGPQLVFGADGQLAKNASGGVVTFDEAQSLGCSDIASTPGGSAMGSASSDAAGRCDLWGPADGYNGPLWVDFGAGPMMLLPLDLLAETASAYGDGTLGGGGGGGGVVPDDGSVTAAKLDAALYTSVTGAAQKASNLSDLTNPAAARTALGLGAAAQAAIGTASGTVAAGNDSRFPVAPLVRGDMTAKGDLLTRDAAGTATVRIPAPGTGQTLKGDTSQPGGMRWVSVLEPGVVLSEDRYPGCTSDVFATAGAARDAAILDCFLDASGAVTTRPRPLLLPPCTRTTAAASGSKAGMYSWPTLDFDWVTKTAMGVTSPSGMVKLGWSIQGIHGNDMYGNVAVKSPSNANCFAFGSGYNHADFMLKGITFTGRENLATTNDWFRVPGGQAFYDFVLDSVSVQWYRYQLRGAFGRFTWKGVSNFNNAAGQSIQLGGSDGGIYGTVYVDSRALSAGTYLVEFVSMTSFKVIGNVYVTPNSAGGVKASGGCEGLSIFGMEVNGLGVQAPEACTDTTQHVGSGLLTGSPSVDPTTAPGLIYLDTTSKTWVKSNGRAQNTGTGDGWSLYYDGTAAIGFNGMANRPSIGSATPGKVYQNTGTEPNGSGGTNPTISYWIPWQGMWHGPSYWNKGSVPTSLVSGASPAHVMTPVYVGCDAPGLYLTGVKGSVHIDGSVKMVSETPGIITNSDGAIQIVDCYDTPVLNMEVSQLGSGRRALAVANSGAVDSVDVRAGIVTSKVPVGDTLAATKTTGACRVFRDGAWMLTKGSTETRANTSTATDITGLDVVVKAGEVVIVEGELALSSTGTPAGGAKLQWSTSGTDLTGRVTFDILATGATGGSSSRNTAACTSNGSGAVAGGVPAGIVETVAVRGRLVGGTTTSTWRIQAAQNTAVTTDTLSILSNSWLRVRRVEA
jgi:hypothetical protein